MSPKNGEEAKDFDAKKGEGEYVRGGREAGCENCGRHKSGICGEGGGKSESVG